MGITITETRVQDKSSGALNIKDIINIIYPVGSIYMSVNNTDPSLIFHGTWERIKDRFLLASGDTYSAGSTGGEAQHTLTVDEMPSHHHTIDVFASAARGIGTTLRDAQQGKPLSAVWDEQAATMSGENFEQHIGNTGSSNPHNNMPPYLTVYIWKRVA